MTNDIIKIQDSFSECLDDSYLLELDVQTDLAATKPLLHKHSRFLYIIQGEAKIKIQDRVYDLTPGSLVSILPWQVSEIIEVTEKISYFLLVYNFNLLNLYIKSDMNIKNEYVDYIDFLYKHSSVLYNPAIAKKIRSIFVDIKNEIGIYSLDIVKVNKKFQNILLMCKLTELFIIFLRNVDAENYESSFSARAENIFIYLFVNSSKDISLEVLSRVFFMSESAISKYIKKVTGIGFYDILHEIRIYKAKFLLLHTSLTLDDIAKIINYSDSAQLSKVFQSKQSMSIKDFKRINSLVEKGSDCKFDENSIKIIEYIYEHYNEDISIVDVSNKFAISCKKLNKILVYFVEQNFFNFLNKIRIHKACELLIKDKSNITDIAIAVGFNSSKTFVRNFVKFMSMTPSDFRKSHIPDN